MPLVITYINITNIHAHMNKCCLIIGRTELVDSISNCSDNVCELNARGNIRQVTVSTLSGEW